MKFFIYALTILSLGALAQNTFSKTTVIRMGYFPNITHAQALVGISKGTFQHALGKNVSVETKVFNAGPSVIEAMFAGKLDIAYIGPNPAINGYIKSHGQALKIVAGACSGGASLVVRKDAGIADIKDLAGKKIASPQLGNTQDVALRAWLKHNDFTLKEKGGNVQVIPVANPDQLTLFLKKEIDAAWTVEPWVSRLIREGNGVLYLDESTLWPDGKFVTAHVIVSKKFLDNNPQLVKKWVEAHVETTLWINEHPDQAKQIINMQIKKETGKALDENIINDAFSRLEITYDPISSSLVKAAESAYEQGFLGKEKPDLSGIYELNILNQLLKEKGLSPVK